ncbi:MAG: OmpH family outer membrane protein [Sphingomonadales bacterium]|nr:OmpH family outer membrane protein [Sphingomonadales bacterium]
MKIAHTLAAALLLAGVSAPALAAKPAPAAPAPAAAAGTVGVNGIAVANIEGVIANSAAFKTAQTQRPVTYKAQIDQAEARRKAIGAQLQPLIDKFKKDQAAGATGAVLQPQAQAIQQIQESGNQELQKIVEPVALSEAYVQEQINDKLGAAIQAAMTKNGVTLLLNPQSVLAVGKSYDLSMAILNELNAALPTAQLVPPAGWLPREQREQQAQQAAQRGNAAAGDGR